MADLEDSSQPWSHVDHEHLRSVDWIERVQQELRRRQATKPVDDIKVVRVSQLDAEELDSQLSASLLQQFSEIFKYLSPDLLFTYKPEFEALLQCLIFHYTIASDLPSPGLRLQNLRYRNERHVALKHGARNVPPAEVFFLTRNQKLMYAFLYIGVRYGWKRCQVYMTNHAWSAYPRNHWRNRLYRLCTYLETAYRIAYIANFVVFLHNGRYRSLIDRLLGIRLVYMRSRVGRQVSFEYMNQQLVMNGLSEFVLFVLPLINFAKLRSFFSSLLPFSSAASQPDGCPVCEADPILTPYVTNCGHVYCYYCLRTSRMTESMFRCLVCSTQVTSDKRADHL